MNKYNFEPLDDLFNMDHIEGATSGRYLCLTVYNNNITLFKSSSLYAMCIFVSSSLIQYFHDKCDQLVNEYDETITEIHEDESYDIRREYKFNDNIHFITIITCDKSSHKAWRNYLHVEVKRYIITMESTEEIDAIMEYLMQRKPTKRVPLNDI